MLIKHYVSNEALRILYYSPINSEYDAKLLPREEQLHIIYSQQPF